MAKTILALGEVLWDLFPDGPRFGGAPANFACACAGLSGGLARVFLASVIGRDKLGTEARERLVALGVEVSHLGITDHLTGQVLINLDSHGRASYRFLEDTAWDHLTATPELLATAASADLVHFGTLGQRATKARDAIQSIVQATSPECLRILDINLRAPHWSPEVIRDSLALANVLKLNDEELPILAELLSLPSSSDDFLQSIVKRFSLRLVALTRGHHGAVLLSANGERSEQPGVPVTVIDTVGAGDAYTAALALGLVQGLPLDRVNRWACSVAAFVCTQPGATPSFPKTYQFGPV